MFAEHTDNTDTDLIPCRPLIAPPALAPPPPPSARLGHLIMTPAFNSNHANAIKAYATDHAVANGMGRGEYAAAFANLRGLSVVIVPQLYARLFAGATVRRSVEHSHHHHFRNCMLGLCSAPSAFCWTDLAIAGPRAGTHEGVAGGGTAGRRTAGAAAPVAQRQGPGAAEAGGRGRF